MVDTFAFLPFAPLSSLGSGVGAAGWAAGGGLLRSAISVSNTRVSWTTYTHHTHHTQYTHHTVHTLTKQTKLQHTLTKHSDKEQAYTNV